MIVPRNNSNQRTDTGVSHTGWSSYTPPSEKSDGGAPHHNLICPPDILPNCNPHLDFLYRGFDKYIHLSDRELVAGTRYASEDGIASLIRTQLK